MGYGRQGKGLPDYLSRSVSQGFCSMELANRDSEQSPFQHEYCHTHVRFQFILFRHEPIISFPLSTLCQRLRVRSKEDFVLFYCYKKTKQNKKFRNLILKLVTFLCSGPIILRSFKKVYKHIKRNSHS